MTSAPGLDRFVAAQDDEVYEAAIEEIRAGEKTGHWMWFVFPQIAGLGRSATARKFALADRNEAIAYSRHDVLGERIYEATEAMLEWAGSSSAEHILGELDAMKFKSSMTLFERCADDDAPFAQALDAFFDGERDAATLDRLG